MTSRGVTTACLYDNGSRPSRSEALIIAVTYGSSTSTISFSKNVGMASSAHDFVGDAVINRRTSSSLHGLVICISPQRAYTFAAYKVAECGRSGG